MALHPGAVRSDFAHSASGDSIWKKAILALFFPLILFTFKTTKQGAQTTIYCVLEDENKLIKGGYYTDCKFTPTKSAQV